MKITPVSETQRGMYVWEMPDGRWVGDEDGHFMHIVSYRGDMTRVAMLRDAARAHGVTEGQPVFLEGHRPVTDEEYEEQRQRLLFGLTPDRLDVGSYMEDVRNKQNGRS